MIEQIVRITFLAINNVAKYEAVFLALKELGGLRMEWINVYNEFLRVVNQVNRTFEAKEEKIKKFLVEIKGREEKFKAFKSHIYHTVTIPMWMP